MVTRNSNIKELCIFCGAPASTREDLFPLWLQHSKSLFNEKLSLLDGSTISYRQLKIEICSKCNNETLSRIEDAVKNQKASILDYYLWTLKIYIGILYKESLLTSIKYRDGFPIINKENIESDLGIAKNIFNVYKNKGSFHPNPPGSIIRIPRIGHDRYFDYSDIPAVPILGIALPNEFIISLPFDKGRTTNITNVEKIPKDMDDLIFRFYIADMGYDEFRWEEGFSSFSVDGMVHITPGSYLLRQPRPFCDKEFIKFLKAVEIKGNKIGEKWQIEKG